MYIAGSMFYACFVEKQQLEDTIMRSWASAGGFVRCLVWVGFGLLAACGREEADSPTARAPGQTGPTNGEIVARLLERHGGEAAIAAVDGLIQRGSGTRQHFGQIPITDGEDPQGYLTELVEVIDLANGQAAFDNAVQIGEGGMPQQRHEVLMNYRGEKIGWGTTGGRPNHVTTTNGLFSWASHNSPEWLLRRNVVTMLRAVENVDPDRRPMGTVIDGSLVWVVESTLNGKNIDLYVDQNSQLLAGWHSVDTETMKGDTEAVYALSNYQEVDGLMLPFKLVISKTDGIFLNLNYESIEINPEGLADWFELPEELAADAEQVLANPEGWVALDWQPVTEHVTHIVAFSHNSMLVEFPDYVVVVEGPYTEAQSITLAREVEERLGKPIRTVVPSHPHYDHTGGLRAFASMGATILTTVGHEAEIRGIVEARHSNPPDALARQREASARVGEVEVFRDTTDITEDELSLELYAVNDIPHVEPMVLAYVPEERVLFQSDLFFGAPGPDAQALHSAINQLGLDVEHIVGGHGGVLSFAALEEAASNTQSNLELELP